VDYFHSDKGATLTQSELNSQGANSVVAVLTKVLGAGEHREGPVDALPHAHQPGAAGVRLPGVRHAHQDSLPLRTRVSAVITNSIIIITIVIIIFSSTVIQGPLLAFLKKSRFHRKNKARCIHYPT